MMATGLLAAVLWFGGAGLLLATGIAGENVGFLFAIGTLFVPLAAPTAFVVGTLLWRYAYSDRNRQLCGALFGAVTPVICLGVGAFGPAALVAADNVARGEMGVLEGVAFGLLLVPIGFGFALVAAGWFVGLVGAFGGWYHERAKQIP
ncbi:hypothetical protein [Natronobacterium texcoconense]